MAERVGLAVAGAGARGAYEAGALAVLLADLEAEGASPTLLAGTSAGALNVVALAANAHLGMAEAARRTVELWQTVRFAQVADVLRSAAGDAGRYLLQLAGTDIRLPSLLDTRHLVDLVSSMVDWEQLHANVRDGAVGAVAVATTSAATQGTVVFVERNHDVALPRRDRTRNITYVDCRLAAEHAVASAAIPVAFRPVRVTEPAAWRGWYVDGGVRLNVPIKPVIALGAARVAVVATHPDTYPAPARPPQRDGAAPDIAVSAAHLLHGALGDRMVEDLRTLAKMNELLGRRAHRRYRAIPFTFAGPAAAQDGEIGALAEREYRRHLTGAGALHNRDLWLLARLIGGPRANHGELLSYLFFDPAFTRPAAELGAEHAHQALRRRPPWQTA